MTLSQGMELVLMLALLVLLIVAGVLVSRMRMLATSLEVTLARLQSEMSKLVNEVTELVDEAGEDVSKFETLLDATNAVTSSMGSASKLAYTAVASPIIKAKALRAGANRLVTVFRSERTVHKGRR